MIAGTLRKDASLKMYGRRPLITCNDRPQETE